MRKKLLQKSRAMLIKVTAVFLLIFAVVSGIYFYMLYNTEKDLLLSNAKNNYNNLVSYYSCNILLDEEQRYNYINGSRAADSEIEIFDEYINAVAKTENIYALNFTTNDNRTIQGYISFERFRSLLTDEQYKKITDFLSGKSGYSLIFTEFYMTDNSDEIIPKRLEIVPASMVNKYYDSENIIESFELTPDVGDAYTLYYTNEKSASDNRCTSIINSDFANGDYENINCIDKLTEHLGTRWIYGYESEGCESIGGFKYVYHNSDYIVRDRTDENGASVYMDSCYVAYAEKFNVLDNCLDRMMLMLIYSVVFFTFAGAVICLISYETVKKQVELEQKRIAFTNAVAHDVKTPLFAISGNAETLLEFSQNDTEKHCAKEIIANASSANELLHDMLELSAVESENYKICTEQFSMNGLINDVLGKLGISPEIFASDRCEVQITADKKLIERVICNLTENALKYTDDKGSVKIKLDSHSFSISNSISADSKIDFKHIWEPYARCDNSVGIKGNGLGLSIVKSILELHNFRYDASRTENTISFRFKF